MKYNKWSEQAAERPTWQFMFVSIAIVLIGISIFVNFEALENIQ